ncbi:MAG: VWA domain-containing protein [Acidobacteria bacterium]|nr:VWA domain-containing protein [Acidobacteriota bacterium]
MSLRFGLRRPGRQLLAVALLGVLAIPAASVAQDRPQFRTTVEVVQLQVAVADSRGDHLPNLTRDDFVLRVDGRVRDLAGIYEVDLRQIQPNEDERFIPAAGWRQFLMFFDFSFSTRKGILRAQESARKFVTDHVHPNDLIGVATYSTVGGLKLVSPFTADRAQVLGALNTFGLQQAGHLVDPAGFALQGINDMFAMEVQLAAEAEQEDQALNELQQNTLDEMFAVQFQSEANDFRRYREEVVNYADQLQALGPLLQAANGRKHVLLFSSGFDDKVLTGQSLDELAEDTMQIDLNGAIGLASVNSETRFGSTDLRETLQKAVENFRHSDVVFHAFDTGGLGNDRTDDTFATTTSGKQGLSYIADGTDGSIHWNMNDLMPSLSQLAEDTARYYVLAYHKDREDPAVVTLDIDLRPPGAQVIAAPRRFAPVPAYTEMDEFQRQLQLAEFITKGIEEEDMIFDVRAVPFAGRDAVSRVAVVLEVPHAQLEEIASTRGDGIVELDLMGYMLDENDEMRDVFSRRVKLDLATMAERMDGLPLRYYDLLWSLPGQQKVRVLVRDAEVGMLSTRTVDLEVPSFHAPEGVWVSGPVAVDSEHPGLLLRGIDPNNPPQHRIGGPVAYPFTLADRDITPQVYTVTAPGGRYQFMMVSYNVPRHPFTGEPQTSLQARIIDELGTEHELASLTVLGQQYDEADDGTTMVLEAALPPNLRPGAYLMEIDLIDAVGGETVQQMLPLLIQSPATDDN